MRSLYDRYRIVWRSNLSLFIFTLSFFVASIFVGWIVVIQKPDFAGVFLSQDLMEMILEKKASLSMGSPSKRVCE